MDAWNQFRGSRGDGIAAGSALAREWPEGGPREIFRRTLGGGFSGVAIVGDRLYTLDADAEHERLLALDARSGVTLWELPVGSRFPSEFGDGPRSTPTVVGERIIAASAGLQLLVATPRGEVLWQRDLAALFGSEQPRFGYSPSPLVVEGRVVLEVGGGDGEGIAAFDLETGEVLWTALDGGAGSSTPILATLGGEPQLIFHRRPEVVALSLDGEVLWRHPSAPDAIVMPLLASGDRVFVSAAAMGRGGVMLAVERGAAGWEVTEEWVQPRMRNHFNTSVLVDGVLYGFDNATLRAVDAQSGELLWATRGFGKGSVVAAGDRLVVLGDAGSLALVEASRSAYAERGRVQATEGRSWTSPSLAGTLLVVRDHDELVAYDVGPGGPQGPSPDGVRSSDAAPPTGVETSGAAGDLELSAVVARFEEARGGRAAWRAVETIELAGTWATFSQPEPFVWRKARGTEGEPDRYRLLHRMLGYDFERGRDAAGPWIRTEMFGMAAPTPPDAIEGLRVQLAAETELEPALMGWSEKGFEVELVGGGEIDGRPTVDVRVVRPGAEPKEHRTEVWHLDPRTGLEIAIDAVVVDPTQGPGTFARRTWLGDFRKIGGIVLPHQIAHEFGARLEEIEVDTVVVDPDLAPEVLDRPPSPPGADSD